MNAKLVCGFLLASFSVIILTFVVFAAAGGATIDWFSIDGGSGISTGGDFTLSGTIGQPDASSSLSGGNYTVVGGFGGGRVESLSTKPIYLPLVVH